MLETIETHMHVNRILSFMKKLSIKQVDKMNALTVKSYSLMDKVVKKMVGSVIGAFVILSSF